MAESEIPLIRPVKEDKIEADVNQLWQDAYSSSVRIELQDRNGNVIDKGSGFLIGEKGDRVGTAFHVIDEGDGVKGVQSGKIVVTTLDGKRYEADVEEEDAKLDAALLKLNDGKVADQKRNVVPISDKDVLGKGDDVLALSNPLGGGLVASLGELDKYENLSVQMPRSGQVRDIPVGKSTFVIMPGSSGGMVVGRDETNKRTEIVGWVSALNQGEFAGSFAPITPFRKWMAGK